MFCLLFDIFCYFGRGLPSKLEVPRMTESTEAIKRCALGHETVIKNICY